MVQRQHFHNYLNLLGLLSNPSQVDENMQGFFLEIGLGLFGSSKEATGTYF